MASAWPWCTLGLRGCAPQVDYTSPFGYPQIWDNPVALIQGNNLGGIRLDGLLLCFMHTTWLSTPIATANGRPACSDERSHCQRRMANEIFVPQVLGTSPIEEVASHLSLLRYFPDATKVTCQSQQSTFSGTKMAQCHSNPPHFVVLKWARVLQRFGPLSRHNCHGLFPVLGHHRVFDLT